MPEVNDPSDDPTTGLPVGTLDDGAVARVGPGGAVDVTASGWTVDWWIGAEDRWHHPSAEAAVRQSLVDDAPVVSTAMRVPGGDVVHRAFAVRAQSDEWSGTGVVVEVENLTAVPVALAVVVRPAADRVAGRTTVRVDGATVSVDGRPVALLSRPAARVVAGPVSALADRLAAGDDAPAPVEVTSDAAGAPPGVAVVVPLPHTAVARVLVPVPPPAAPRRRSATVAAPSDPWQAPDAAAVTAGWTTHTGGAARLELPEPSAAGFLVRAERFLLLGATDAAAQVLDRGAAEGAGQADGAAALLDLVDALARCGLDDPVGPVATALVAAQRLRGAVPVGDGSDATVALVVSAAALLAGPRADRWMDELVGPLAKAVDRLARGRVPGADPARAAAALAAAAASLRHVDQPDVAAWADEVAAALDPGYTGVTTGRVLSALDAASPSTASQDTLERSRGVVDVLGGLVAWTPGGLRLCDGWAVSWAGQDVEAYDVRTPWGRAGFALRWHETRPALLWEIVPGPGSTPDRPPTITADRLDPAWAGEGWEGEALLAAPAGAAPAPQGTTDDAPGEGESFG